MTNKQVWFDTLDKVCKHWGRHSDGSLYLWFNGYFHQDLHDAELTLIKLGGRSLGADFHRDNGQTCLRIREPKFTKQRIRRSECSCDNGVHWNNGDDTSGQSVECRECA